MEFDPNYISPAAFVVLMAVELIALYIARRKNK